MILFWLQIIRIKNIVLLILFLTALYWRFYREIISSENFLLVVFLTSITAAFGNAANDVFDIDNDVRNGCKKALCLYPEKKTLVKKVLLWSGIFIHLTLFMIFFNNLLFFFFCISAFWLLYFYSNPYFLHFKSVPLLGNIIIAGLSAASLLIFSIFSKIFVKEVLFWAMSAFFLSVSREIVKDAEDLKGDKASGIHTLASVFGIGVSRFFSLIFTLFLFPVVYWAYKSAIINFQSAIILSFFIAILLFFINFAKEKIDFTRLSFAHKLLMMISLLMIL